MNKNLFTIDESEKRRILEMHQDATRNQYIFEQDVTTQTTTSPQTTQEQKSSVIGGVTVTGFLFAEDDLAWLDQNPSAKTFLQNKQAGYNELISNENFIRLKTYYGYPDLQYEGSSVVNPLSLKDKYAIMFNQTGDYESYAKANAVNSVFKIGLIYKGNSGFVFITTGKAANEGPNIQKTPRGLNYRVGNSNKGRVNNLVLAMINDTEVKLFEDAKPEFGSGI